MAASCGLILFLISGRRKNSVTNCSGIQRSRIKSTQEGEYRMKRKSLVVLSAFLVLLLAKSVVAHHSFDAEFDRNKPVTLKGAVTRVDWGNPHIWIFIDVKDENGKVTNWGVEGG